MEVDIENGRRFGREVAAAVWVALFFTLYLPFSYSLSICVIMLKVRVCCVFSVLTLHERRPRGWGGGCVGG